MQSSCFEHQSAGRKFHFSHFWIDLLHSHFQVIQRLGMGMSSALQNTERKAMVSTGPHWYAHCLGHMICPWGKLYSQLEGGSLSSQFLRPQLLESLLPSILKQSTQLGVNKQDLCYLFGKPPKPPSSCWTQGIACLYPILFPSLNLPALPKLLSFFFSREENGSLQWI